MKMISNIVKNIFHFICWPVGSEDMSHGSSSIIVQSLKTLQQNAPRLKILNNNKYMFYY